MKEYEVKVVEERIVYVYADTEDDAIELAKTEAIHEAPDSISCQVISAIDEDDMDLTICGEHGCDGCFIRYSGDIEACKREAERKKENKDAIH